MECEISQVAMSADEDKIKTCIAKELHQPKYRTMTESGQLINMNFDVHLFKAQDDSWEAHTGRGRVVFPDAAKAALFVQDFSHRGFRPEGLNDRKVMRLTILTTHAPAEGMVEYLRRTPFVHPKEEEQIARQRQRDAELLPVHMVQFGRVCRDQVFSVERAVELNGKAVTQHHRYQPEGWLSFDTERARFHIGSKNGTLIVQAVRVKRVICDPNQRAIILFLDTPPAYERTNTADAKQRNRLEAFADGLESIIAFTSRHIRVVFPDKDSVPRFDELAQKIKIDPALWLNVASEARNLYSAKWRKKVRELEQSFDLRVAIQLDALLHNCSLTPEELCSLGPAVKEAAAPEKGGDEHAAEAVRRFNEELTHLDRASPKPFGTNKNLLKLFHRVSTETSETSARSPLFAWNAKSMQLTVTPTTMWLQGPFEDMSNRVLRRYVKFQHHFLRVSFADEDGMPYRYEKGLDWPDFLRSRVGRVLREGIRVAGRRYDFLAFSMSSLRARTVWFVTPFHQNGQDVTADVIRDSLGDFSKVMSSPARYGARIAQAFTATSPSVTLRPDQIKRDADIIRNGYCFTDGAARMSPALAEDVWFSLHKGIIPGPTPAAYQFRLGGYKGVVCVDTRLDGKVMCVDAECLSHARSHVRPSCDKFDAEDSLDLEIAQSFAYPSVHHLSRPLISVLEARGVPAKTFLLLQREALRQISHIITSLKAAAKILPQHGLGSAFDIPNILGGTWHLLNRYEQQDDFEFFRERAGMLGPFMRDVLHLSMLHIKRALKTKARIPVPHAHLLVGVPDETGLLREGEIYCAVRERYSDQLMLYQGSVLISRSPTVHPGDAQLAIAVGARSEEFFQARENVIVFSTQGPRPLCNMLAGGDLDGDEYSITALRELHPKPTPPASYPAVEDWKIDGVCTKDHIIDGVVRFFARDVLGLIGDRHLLIADQAASGPYDSKCMKLSELYSTAVDSAKSGMFPALEEIPRRIFPLTPDFMAPSVARRSGEPDKTYRSQRALGHLYRTVGELPTEDFSEVMRNDIVSDGDSILTQEIAIKLQKQGIDSQVDHDLLQDARSWMADFSSALRHIAFDNTDGQGVVELSEVEVITGTIARPPLLQKHRKSLLERLEAQSKMLAGTAKVLMSPPKAPRARRAAGAWAAWTAANEHPMYPTFGTRGYALVALSALYDLLNELQ